MSWQFPPDAPPWSGVIPLGSNFNVTYGGPIDNRIVVDSVADLINIQYPYAGMVASVWTGTIGSTDNGVYYYDATANAQGQPANAPTATEWIKLGSGTGGGNVTDVLIQKSDTPGLEFTPTTAQTGNVIFTLRPIATSGTSSGTYFGLETFFTGINPETTSSIYKVGQPGAIPAINYDNNDYIWKQFNLFDLATTATPTWYTQYKQAGQVGGNTKDLYGLNSRITLDKNITFNIGDSTNDNKITSGEVCTLIIKHLTDHSFTLTAGQVNGSVVTHKVVGAGPNPFTLTNTAGAVDIISGLWDDPEQTMYWTIGLNYGGGSAPPPPGNFVELEGSTDLVELEGSTGVVEIE